MIRWITDRLGTAPATSAALDDSIARVDVRDLVDKFGNNAGAVRAKIDEGVGLLADGRRVVVCCDYGISRSNAVAAGVLAVSNGVSLDEALRQVVAATGEQEIKLEPIGAVRAALRGVAGARVRGARPRVLITGGTGFIGGHLVKALEGAAEIVLTTGSELDLTVGALGLDLLVQEHAIDQIVHLANPRVYTSNRAMGDTLSMLRNVLDTCRSSGARLVYLSSWETYSGYRASEIRASEMLPLLPKGPYGETKMLCENLIAHHRKMYDLDCGIIRSSPVFGQGSDKPKFLFNFIRKARSGAESIRTHRYRNGSPALDLMHVADLISAIKAVVELRPVGDFNIGGGKLHSTATLAEQIAAACGATCRVEYQDIEDDVANVLIDSTRARSILGWAPTRSFKSSLPELLAIVANA